jgi:hypothetical protein
MTLHILSILSSVSDVFFCIYTIIGTNAPESVNVNYLTQDFYYKPCGCPMLFTMNIP